MVAGRVLLFALCDSRSPVRWDYHVSMGGTPRVVLSRPGWRLDYADEQSVQDGKLCFASPSADSSSSASEPTAEIHWRRGDLSSWLADRRASAPTATTMPVLGVVAHVCRRPHDGLHTIVALWELDDRVFEFRARVVDLDAFAVLLDSLRRIEESEWLSALPPDVVKPADHEAIVTAMLRAVTVPPGFEPNTIKGVGLVKDRYQFGVLVAGTVACTWFQRWSQARRRGDSAGMQEAIDAMSTAKDWPVLREMAKKGAYPEVLKRFAEAMPSGHWHGRTLEGDVNSGLGCPALGVPLTDETS
jgi:hypothetical protein